MAAHPDEVRKHLSPTLQRYAELGTHNSEYLWYQFHYMNGTSRVGLVKDDDPKRAAKAIADIAWEMPR